MRGTRPVKSVLILFHGVPHPAVCRIVAGRPFWGNPAPFVPFRLDFCGKGVKGWGKMRTHRYEQGATDGALVPVEASAARQKASGAHRYVPCPSARAGCFRMGPPYAAVGGVRRRRGP